MRYSVFAGGKRLRPILCKAAAEACGGEAGLQPAAVPKEDGGGCLEGAAGPESRPSWTPRPGRAVARRSSAELHKL